ncbi:unnamed protein product [Cladocopium goreaui]|uniref:Uncharacterized protein n=1 Tax=Cladocopium goreaui TaxID=2562237 RepID=A0A9P1FU16_9DINO|nr:unnamed protein product [Cladocopium goreaui]
MEHPAGSLAWNRDSVQYLLEQEDVRLITFDQCMFGLVSKETKTPMQKRCQQQSAKFAPWQAELVVQYKSALQACEDETGLDPDIARALFDSQDGGTSEAPTTIHSDVILTNKEKLFDLAYAEFKSHGGVRQYLHRMFSVESTRATDLAAILKKLILLRQDVDYLTHYPVPACLPGQEGQQLPFMVPLWLFSVQNESSLREPTALDLSRQILQQFACDGFLTAGNPVMIRIQDDALTQSREEIPSGGLWFLKGAGRIHTVMALMVYISKHTTSTLEVFDELLYKTLSNIHCKHVRLRDKQAELFFNMKESVRGGIRAKPNAISWVYSFLNLSSWTKSDPISMIRAWNEEASRDDRLVSTKKTSVTSVLDLPVTAREILLAIVSEFGFEGSPFSDDCLSSKRYLPGYSFKGRNTPRGSPWIERGKVTKKSCVLMFNMIWSQHKKTPKNLNKSQLEEKAEVCALACALVQEVILQVPNTEKELENRFLTKLAEGESVMDMELQSALMSKDEKYSARDCPSIAAILNDLCDKSSPNTSSVELLTAVQMGEQRVMSQAFELLLSELDFDVKSWRVHLRKIKEWDLRVWHQRDLWQIERHNSAKSAAQDILKKKVNLLSWPEKISAGSAVELVQALQQDVKAWAHQLKCNHVVGKEAGVSLLKAITDGVQLSSTSAIYIVDYVPVVGDFAHAALTLSTSLNVPVRYAGLPDPAHHEWLQEFLTQDLIDQLLTDKIKPTAGHSIPAQDPPAEHMDQKPEPPQMKKMTFVKVDGEAAGIQVPDSVQKVWHTNATHGAEFRAWMDTFNEEFPKPEKKGTKRVNSNVTTVTPKKIPKIGSAPVDMSMLTKLLVETGSAPTGTELQRVNLLNLTNIDLIIQTDAIFLTNLGEQPVTIAEGTSLCGFGRGAFRFGTESSGLQEHEIPFDIKDVSSQMAILDGRPQYFGDLMESMRQKFPDKPVLQYYEAKLDMVEHKWELKKVNDLIFAPRLDEDKAGQTTCAKLVAPAMKWESAWTGFAWHIKQTQTGLQPQRPVIVATKSVEIKPGMTLVVDTV